MPCQPSCSPSLEVTQAHLLRSCQRQAIVLSCHSAKMIQPSLSSHAACLGHCTCVLLVGDASNKVHPLRPPRRTRSKWLLCSVLESFSLFCQSLEQKILGLLQLCISICNW